MPLSSRMKWSIPTEDADPWYEAFTSLINEQDQAAYAAREDRNLILMGGGDISWDATTSTLAWTEPIRVFSPISGLQCLVAAGSAFLEQDGQLLHAPLVRYPTGSNKTITAAVASQVPSATLPNSQLLFALRWNGSIYWRNGLVQEDGVTITNFAPAAGFVAGGDLSGSAVSQTVIGFQGRTVAATAPTVGQVYKWNGSSWAPSADATGTMPTFVFRPGGAASGNVYTDWANLMSAVSTIEGPVWIDLDDHLSSLTIPAGTWDLEGRAFLVSSNRYSRTQVYLADGAVVQNAAGFEHLNVYGTSGGTGKFTWTSGTTVYAFDCGFTTASSANSLLQPYVSNTWYMRDTTFTSNGASYPVFEPITPANGGQEYLYLEGFSSIDDNVFAGTRTINVYLESGWTTCGEAHAAFSGTLNINALAGAVPTTFVYQPGGAASANVYTDWNLLMADLVGVAGPKIIEFDASADMNDRCDIPSGTHALGRDTVLRGRWAPDGSETRILMADGAVFQDASVLEGGLEVWSASSSSVFSWSGNPRHLILRESVTLNGGTLTSAPTSPLISGGEGTDVILTLRDDSAVAASSGDQNVLYGSGGAAHVVNLYDRAKIISGDGSDSASSAIGLSSATAEVRIFDQAVYFQHIETTGLTWKPYCIRVLTVPLCKGVESNASNTPAACGAAYVSFKNLPKHQYLSCKYRVIIETTSGSAGYEAYIDLYDVHGQLNGGTPQVVPGSQIDTGTSLPPAGAPTPNSLIPSLYETDLTSAIVGGTWVDDIAVFEARVWIGTAAGGNAATCKSAELVFEWTEEILPAV